MQPGLASDAASSASRRGPVDHNTAQRPYDCAVQDDSQPRPNPNATSSTLLSRKRAAHHLPPKSPATSPNDNVSSRLHFSAPESAAPIKRRRSYSGYAPTSSVSPRVAPLQAQEPQKRRQAFQQPRVENRNPAHIVDQDSAKMNVASSSLQTAFRMGDASSLAMSQALQAHSQALPSASGARVSASPAFVMPNNQIPLDMSAQGFTYVPCMDGKNLPGVLQQNSIPIAGVTASMPNLGNPQNVPGQTKKASQNSRTQSRSLKNDKGVGNQGRTNGDKPSEDVPISERLQRSTQRLRDSAMSKEGSDALGKMKAEVNPISKPGSKVQSNNAKAAASNQVSNPVDPKDPSRVHLAHESSKVKNGNGLRRSTSLQNALVAGVGVAIKTKAGDDAETETRSTRSDRNPPANRATTPSQRSTASGGSNAVERRASQGSGPSKRARNRTKARSSTGGKRSRADRGQIARNNSSRNTAAAQTPRSTITDVKNATSVNTKMKAAPRNLPADRSNPMIHVNSVMGAITDPSQGSDKRRQGRNDGNAKTRTGVPRQPQVAGEEPKLTFENVVEKNTDHGGHDPQHGRQSPNAMASSGPAQLFDMLPPPSGGARSIDNGGLDAVDGMAQFSIATGSHNGKVNGGNGPTYPYELPPFLSAGVEEEPMLGNISSMLNNMQDAVDLGSTDFEDDSLLGPADPADLIGRNRS
ncbi:unnamed protein product [Agarophyton chilense]